MAAFAKASSGRLPLYSAWFLLQAEVKNVLRGFWLTDGNWVFDICNALVLELFLREKKIPF
jgi:hypothetical protein